MADITLKNNQSLTLRLKACGLSSADIKKVLTALSPELENKVDTDLENVANEVFKNKADAAGVGGVGRLTDGNGEIFNDYENNVALGNDSHVEGYNSSTNISTAHIEGNSNNGIVKAYHILEQSIEDPYVLTLDSTADISVGMNLNIFVPTESGLSKWRGTIGSIIDETHIKIKGEYTEEEFKTIFGDQVLSIDNTSIPLNLIVNGGTVGSFELKDDTNNFSQHIEGSLNYAGLNCHAEGIGSQAIGYTSHSEGYFTSATGERAHTEGYRTIGSGNESHAENTRNVASGYSSHAEGLDTEASGYVSHSEGKGTKATGNYSHTEGGETVSAGIYSHSEGYKTQTTGSYGHAEGDSTKAGYRSHSEGWETESVNCGHAEGKQTLAQGTAAHAEGDGTKALSNCSHAENNHTTASGYGAHAQGNNTEASGTYSHAQGTRTKASGENAHAEGSWTIATGKDSHVQGRFNVEDTNNEYAHIIGNGTSASNRSNAHTVDWDGNAWFAGDITIGKNNDKLITEKEVNSKLSTVYKYKGSTDPGYLSTLVSNGSCEIGDVYNMIKDGTVPSETISVSASVVSIDTDGLTKVQANELGLEDIVKDMGTATASVSEPFAGDIVGSGVNSETGLAFWMIIPDDSSAVSIGSTGVIEYASTSFEVLEGDNIAKIALGWDKLAGTVDLSNYAEKSTTLSGYGITDAYAKTEIDSKLGDIESALDAIIAIQNELLEV